ncbi:hypothetical protein KI387_016746 [Taxus chinensis]|uniref:Acyl carrier protein n=1 Tax=Taxus chinensis TaxID=29808 RepID=A0AA38GEH2_TAXCH|nr:hypothetical protein KI387_016746 [Taxus chinensis]
MASASGSSLRIGAALAISSTQQKQVARRSIGFKDVSFAPRQRDFPSLQTAPSSSYILHVCCAAKQETVTKVCDIVKKQLALSDDAFITPESKFSTLGADSLDTVEIVMALEEEFQITVEEESSENITTVQEAADMIERLMEKK